MPHSAYLAMLTFTDNPAIVNQYNAAPSMAHDMYLATSVPEVVEARENPQPFMFPDLLDAQADLRNLKDWMNETGTAGWFDVDGDGEDDE